MKITFLRDYKVKAADGEEYKEGQTIEVDIRSALHFINRGAAKEADMQTKRIVQKVREQTGGDTRTIGVDIEQAVANQPEKAAGRGEKG